MEAKGWKECEDGNWAQCGNCNRKVTVKDAMEIGCNNPKCPKVLLSKIEHTTGREEVKLIHKFERNPDGPYSTKKVVGVYNVKGDINKRRIEPEYTFEVPPKPEGTIRFVCISDTHETTESLKPIPDGDVLIHAGDFTYHGKPHAVREFNDWLGTLHHPVKIVIAGNHDITFDVDYYNKKNFYGREKHDAISTKNLLTNCIYLEDSEVTIYGIRIYGSPWQPDFCDWAFNAYGEEAIKKYWDLIPTGIDILITHGPPLTHCGIVLPLGNDAGCPQLLKAVDRTKPKVHVFGHIHEGYGVDNDHNTVFINASSLNGSYKPTNHPIVFDLTSS